MWNIDRRDKRLGSIPWTLNVGRKRNLPGQGKEKRVEPFIMLT